MTTGYRPELIQGAFVNFIGAHLQPFWSLTQPKLRLIARRTLSDELIALQFESNRAFKQQVFDLEGGWHGGQHLNLRVLIEGIYHQRSYSLVGLPQQLLWWQDNAINTGHNNNKKQHRHTVTIAIKPQGLVSDYLTNHAPLGTIFDSSVPNGDFTLAQAALIKQVNSSIKEDSATNSELNKPAPLLFIAGGSGITPMLGLITQALQRGHQVTLLHYNRTSLSQSLLNTHWQHLATTYPTFNYHLVDTEDPNTYLAGTRHLSTESLLALGLPLANTQIFACGSHALLAGLFHAAAEVTLPSGDLLRDNIIIENFGNVLPEPDSDETAEIEAQTIYLRGRQRQFSSSTTLLVDAEHAGIRLTHGCRQGICHMCRCNKVSGVVKNIQTGKLSSDGYESIQTCINVAITDVVLDI